MKLNKKQIGFLNKCTKGKWTLNEETGLVDIEGDFNCSRVYGESLTDFKGVKFGVVTGDFRCSNNSLTSLEGAPQEVGGDFICRINKITSLVGAPRKIGRDFYCENNPISKKTLNLVWETMQEKNIDYWKALCILNKQIPNGYWKKMSRGLDEKLSKGEQKVICILERFGHFH